MLPHLDATDLTSLVRDTRMVRAWLFGHTHWSSSQAVGLCRFMSNQQGYAARGDSDGVFAADFVLDLDTPVSAPEYHVRGHYELGPPEARAREAAFKSDEEYSSEDGAPK